MLTSPLPTELPYVSLFVYSPRGVSQKSQQSRDVTFAIKKDGTIPVRRDGSRQRVHAIDLAAQLAEERFGNYEFFRACFGTNVALVPTPRSSLIVKGGLWPAKRIAESLVEHGLAEKVMPCVERVTPVKKSATSPPGERPGPEDHYDSMKVTLDHWDEMIEEMPERITIIDDVITRGATLLAMYSLVSQRFPRAVVRSLAVVRTMSSQDVESIWEPVEGRIVYRRGTIQREP